MKDTLENVLRASELFNERLSAAISNNDEDLMQDLLYEFRGKGLKLEIFKKMLSDFSACLAYKCA